MRERSKSEEKIKAEKEATAEEIVELYEERSRKRRKKKIRRELKKSDYLFSILVSFVLLYIFNNLPKGSIGFITARFVLCLPVINVSLGAAIFGNFLFLFSGEERFKSSVRMVLNLLSVAAIYSLYQFFPFNFSEFSFFNAEPLVRVVLLLGTVATGVAAIIEFFKVMFNTFDWR